jgi:hypothetical protein
VRTTAANHLPRVEKANLVYLAEQEGRDPSWYTIETMLGQYFAVRPDGTSKTL